MLPLTALSALLAATLSVELVNAHGVHGHIHVHKRQSTPSAGTTSSTTATTSPAGATTPAPTGNAAGTGKYDIPPLSLISANMPPGPLQTLSTTYAPGAQPTYSGAIPLPSPAFQFTAGVWPDLDVVPPTDSAEVKEWMKELEGHDIPDFRPTVDGGCASDPEAAAEAEKRGWWTCGKYTSGNDIVVCPDKYTWGVSFDDGPSPQTPKLLRYLDDIDISATFFVVGSRVISYPDILVAEYMAGHEISVHTWSHRPLTMLTNEQIVAELGWTRKAIQSVIGVTPISMRAPFGDIDNRVRAIANAMGLRPIIWTTTPGGVSFDTNDWRVAGGSVNAVDQVATFNSILGNASVLDTGFIVLAHDLYEVTVDLAVGYTVDAALKHNPPFKLEAIGQCLNFETRDMYHETATTDLVNSNPDTGSNSSSGSGNGNGTSSGAAGEGGNGAAGLRLSSSALVGVVAAAVAAVFAGSL